MDNNSAQCLVYWNQTAFLWILSRIFFHVYLFKKIEIVYLTLLGRIFFVPWINLQSSLRFYSVLLKARLSSKLEAPRLQRFLPQKLGSFKEVRFRSALFCTLSKSSKRAFWHFFIFFKKINQNWNKTLGSWHYWYKPLIWYVFSVTYLSKKDILSVTCPKRLKPNPQPPSSSLCPHILSSFMEKKKVQYNIFVVIVWLL